MVLNKNKTHSLKSKIDNAGSTMVITESYASTFCFPVCVLHYVNDQPGRSWWNEWTSLVYSTQMFKRWSPGYCKIRLVSRKMRSRNGCHLESRMRVERQFDHEDFDEELTRCEMYMTIEFFFSQEEVHRISNSSTKKKSITVEIYSRIHIHF